MKKYAKVQFGNNSTKYTYMTHFDNLNKGDTLLVDTANGLAVAKFHTYDASDGAKNVATKWIYRVLVRDTLVNNLKMELKEEGITYQDFKSHKRYMQAKTMVDKSRAVEAKSFLRDYVKDMEYKTPGYSIDWDMFDKVLK